MNSDEEYWIAMKNILKYLRRTKDLLLIFGGGSELKVEKDIDSDIMTDVDDRMSTSSVFFIGNYIPKSIVSLLMVVLIIVILYELLN